jgi:hypothetical protein
MLGLKCSEIALAVFTSTHKLQIAEHRTGPFEEIVCLRAARLPLTGYIGSQIIDRLHFDREIADLQWRHRRSELFHYSLTIQELQSIPSTSPFPALP